MAKEPTENTVPARRDLKKVEIHKQSRANEIAGRKPGFRYQYFSKDPKHPQYIGNYLREHEKGNDDVGYVRVAPWQVVNAKESGIAQASPRDDQGKPLGTTVERGDLILAELPEDEANKYDVIQKMMADSQAKRLKRGGMADTRDLVVEDGYGTYRGTVQEGGRGMTHVEALKKSERE